MRIPGRSPSIKDLDPGAADEPGFEPRMLHGGRVVPHYSAVRINAIRTAPAMQESVIVRELQRRGWLFAGRGRNQAPPKFSAPPVPRALQARYGWRPSPGFPRFARCPGAATRAGIC